jgi:galactose mutarotase-like enzyme
MKDHGHLITLHDPAGAEAVIAPELGGWLLRYTRRLPGLGHVDGLYFDQEVLARYPNQMYAGNPLLFPQVSFSHLPGEPHHYKWEGNTYALPQHGFARLSKWTVADLSETRLTMELTDTRETLAAYPFSFRFLVTYELLQGRLSLRQTIENRDERPMPFSTGIHPYFPVPMTTRGKRERCLVEISSGNRMIPAEDWESWTIEPFTAQFLPVQEDVSGTFFLADLHEKEIGLVDTESGVRITLNFADAPLHRFVALWSKSTAAPFYCIEPWTALPNSFRRADGELILLNPGDRFDASMWIDISRAAPEFPQTEATS